MKAKEKSPILSRRSGSRAKQCHDISVIAQRKRLLSYLREVGSVTTVLARERLNIFHPAGRICELRQAGHHIKTLWITEVDSFGRSHRVARYMLSPSDKRGRASYV